MKSSQDETRDINIDNSTLRQQGFTKFSLPIRSKTMFIWYNDRPIIAKFEKFDLVKTVKSVKKKFSEEGIDTKTFRNFVTYFTEEYLKLKDSDFFKSSDSSGPSVLLENEKITNYIIEQIKKLRTDNANIAFEEWQRVLIDKYNIMEEVAESNFPHSWPGIEFTLSVLRILNIAGCTLPFAGIMLARSGGNKTLSCDMVIPWPSVYYTRNFTARAFVSHNTAVSKEDLCEIDMLPKIRFKLLLTPELTPLFSASEDELMENLGIITSVLDGKGYVSNSGAHGRRGYYGNYMFTWVGAAVDISYRVNKLLATLGPKLYFFRLPYVIKTDRELIECQNENFDRKRQQVQDAVIDYLIWFESCPVLKEDNESGLLKMEWHSENDSIEAKNYLKDLGKLLAKQRGHVDIWSSTSRQHEYLDYSYSFTQTEDEARAITQLYNLARGHTLLKGRNYVTMDDISLAVKVVLSTASIERVAIFDLLLAKGGAVTLSKIVRTLPFSKSIALKTMTELEALKVVDKHNINIACNDTIEIRLRPEFNWLLSDEFIKLKEGFTPVDTSEYTKIEDHNDKEYYVSVERFAIFIDRFERLERKSVNGTVSGQKLKEELISSNKFFVGDAVQILREMVRVGYLEQLEFDTYSRRHDSGDLVSNIYGVESSH